MATPPTSLSRLQERAFAPLTRPVTILAPANQNGAPVVDEAILVDALRHFGEYGLGAAAEAIHRAKRARASGEREECQRWLAICRAFDRRMAARFEAELLSTD